MGLLKIVDPLHDPASMGLGAHAAFSKGIVSPRSLLVGGRVTRQISRKHFTRVPPKEMSSANEGFGCMLTCRGATVQKNDSCISTLLCAANEVEQGDTH